MGGRDESIVPGDSTLSTIRWIHSDVSRATAHGSVHISRLGNDLRQSHPIVDQTDAESMKPLKKVGNFSPWYPLIRLIGQFFFSLGTHR